MRQRDVETNWKALRLKLGLSQLEFWTPVHVTQSAGSRYEGGRVVPMAVVALLCWRYKGVEIERYAPEE